MIAPSSWHHMTMAVATPQPGVPRAGTCHSPNGPGSAAPKTNRAVSGIFSASAPSCSTITAFGRDTATLKPR